MRLILKLLERLEEHGTSSKDLDFAVKYLEYYGYIPEEDGSVKKYYKAVKKFQKAFGLLDDGYLGKKTIGAMNQPRCGLPDAMVIEGPPKKWNHNILTYYIRNRDGDLDPEIWDEEIEKAFNSWTEVCNVKFIRTNKTKSANIVLDTGDGAESNFDGPGGTLAWAYLPGTHNYAGQLLMKFDEKETWITDPSKRGCLLQNVAAHEIGHILGLHHSDKDGALMAPHYNPSIITPQENDDIPRIQSLYGKRV